MKEEDDMSDVSKTSCFKAREEQKPGKGRRGMSRKMLSEQKRRSEGSCLRGQKEARK